MAQREIKKTIIIIIYLLIFSLIVTAAYFKLKRDPSCFDGRRNQGEEGVDCGGPCVPCPEIVKLKPIQIESVEWVHDIDDKYDVIARVTNPNDVYGVGSVSYRAVIRDATDEVIDESSWQKNFLLPGESKYFFVQGFETDKTSVSGASVEIFIDEGSVEWKKFKNFEEPNLIINNPGYEKVSGGGVGFGRAFGTVINRSNFDLEIVNVKVVLRDGKGNLLAVNSQIMNTLRAQEYRDYVINFPHHFPGSVNDVKAYPESNPFDSENYIRVHGSPDSWSGN